MYRLYDAEGALLYVGITRNLGQRMVAHKRMQPWWSEVARVEPEMHLDRSAARGAELVAIQSEHPRYNVADVEPPPAAPVIEEEPGKLVGSVEAARAVAVDRTTLARWVGAGKVRPTLTTAGGHHRYDLADLRRQLATLAE